MADKAIPQLRGPRSGPARGPGRPSGRMFAPRGRGRGFPREPGPRWDGPRPCAPPEPPWEQQRRERPPSPRGPRPFPGPGDIPWNEEERRWPPHEGPWAPHEGPWPPHEGPQPPHEGPWPPHEGPHPPHEGPWPPHEGPWAPHEGPWPPHEGPQPPHEGPWAPHEGPRPPHEGPWAPHERPWPPHWEDRDFQGHEDGFGDGWHQPPWEDRDFQGHEDGFGDTWHQELLPEAWPGFPGEEPPPPWPPAGPPRNPGAFRAPRPPGRHSLRRSHLRQLTPVPLRGCPRPPRGHKPHSKPSHALSKRSQPEARKELQPPEPPQPPAPLQGAVGRPEQPQDLPVGTGNVLEPPSLAGSPPETPAAEPSTAEPVPGTDRSPNCPQAELGAGQTPVGSQDQDPHALGTDPAPPEETSRYPEIQEHLEVEPCSAGVPKAGTGHGSHPQSPAAPAEAAKREPSSSGEAGAELSPHSWERLPCGAGGAEAEAAQDGPLQSLQPPETPQISAGAAAEPEAQPSQASPGACPTAEPSPGPQRPPGAGETNPAVCEQPQLCSVLPAPFLSGADLRSAAVLAKKAQIERSYQQFSLAVAVVAAMLLQKEPSMEAALGLALRANLRQRRAHHLQELEQFIDSIDAAIASL